MRFFLRLFLIFPALAAMAEPVAAAEMPANAIFLVAKRELSDPNFRETVVLVTLPPRGGPFGVIVNRPLGERLSEIFSDQPSLKGRADVLYFGGPVARQGLVFLVRSSDPPEGALRVLRDVFFTSDLELIEGLFQRKDPLRGLRIFAGYSGWAPGQLQNEIARGGWHVVPADAETLFDKDPARVWQELIERATTKQAEVEGRKAKGTPFSPSALSFVASHHPSPVTHHAFRADEARP